MRDWINYKLSDIADVPISYGVVQTGTPQIDGVPCVRVTDLTGPSLDKTRMISTTPEISEAYRRTVLKEGDLMIALRGEIGLVRVATKELEGCNLTRGVARISPRRSLVDPNFLAQVLNFYHLSQLFHRISNGSALREIPIATLRNVHIELPPTEEQSRIATFLSGFDDLIGKTEQLIIVNEKRKQWIMQKYLTGAHRLLGFKGAWREVRLGEVFRERIEPKRGHLPLLSITREQGVIPRDEVDRKDTSTKDKSKYLRICPGDIGYNTMRMWQGVSALSTLEGIVSPAYTVCIPKAEVDGEFMAYLFKVPRTVHEFERHSQGLVSDTWNLKFHHFSEITVTIPGKEEQKAISRILRTADEEIRLLRQQLDAFKRQKRGMMQKLLTGQWRVAAS